VEGVLKIAFKIWLDNDGKAFGEGPYELLKGVEATSSLNRAAQRMGMSYSKAWKLVQLIEERLGFALLEKKVGGPSGGGSHVTPGGRDLLQRYERFETEARKAMEKLYRKHFGNVKFT
jgi:molybdate transport system regulatory protein